MSRSVRDPDYRQEGPTCASRMHKPPVPATVHGTFGHPDRPETINQDVWYCNWCADGGQAVGLFTPDEN